MRTSRRRFALGAAAAGAALLLALLLLPVLFQDRIVSRFRAEIGRAVAADVAWDGAGVSLLRDFPNVGLTVRRPSVVGVAPFAGDTLAVMREARLVLDLGSVVRFLRRGEPVVVRELALRDPAVRLIVLADGTRNWDIARDTGAASRGGRSVRIALRDLRVTDGAVSLDDRHARLAVVVRGLQESLRGDFARERFSLATRTRADSVSVRFAGVPYLSRVGVALDATVDADATQGRYAFRDATLRLNQLVLGFDGTVTTASPDVALDLAFASPGTAFADILSLMPAVYARDFARLRTAGSMAVRGQVRGRYGPAAFPALAIRARVRDGSFRHPDLPLPAREIALDLAIDNPGGHVDRTVVTLDRFHAVIGRRPIDGRLVLRTPVTDPDVDLRLVGALDLDDLARTVKLAEGTAMQGRVAADVAMRARLSDLDAARYERVDARGTVHASRVAVRGAALPHPVAVDTAALRLTPRTAELTALTTRVGRSDVRATGTLDNVLGWMLRDDALRGRASVASRHLDLNEWRSDEATMAIPVPARVDFALDARADEVRWGTLAMTELRGGVRVRDRRATIEGLRMTMLRGGVAASGWYETVDPARPTFDLDLRLDSIAVPAAFAAIETVQRLAPLARWTRGSVSGAVGLRGALQPDMAPVLGALTGRGTIETDRLVVQDAPLLGRVADALSLESLRHPTLGALRASFDIVEGRLHVKPFAVAVQGVEMSLAGSNGVDQTIDYQLGVAAPRGAFGGGLARLASQSGRTLGGIGISDVVRVTALVTGTVTAPSVRPSFAGTVASAREAVQGAVREEIAARQAAAEQKVDSVAAEARRRARAEAERAVAEAERRADEIRAEARTLAESLRREATERADSLAARATTPAARLAARATADRFRREADQQADRIVREADARADAVVADARRRADAGQMQ